MMLWLASVLLAVYLGILVVGIYAYPAMSRRRPCADTIMLIVGLLVVRGVLAVVASWPGVDPTNGGLLFFGNIVIPVIAAGLLATLLFEVWRSSVIADSHDRDSTWQTQTQATDGQSGNTTSLSHFAGSRPGRPRTMTSVPR